MARNVNNEIDKHLLWDLKYETLDAVHRSLDFELGSGLDIELKVMLEGKLKYKFKWSN